MEKELNDLKEFCRRAGYSLAQPQPLPNGGVILRVNNVDIGPGWNRTLADVLFLAPPGYPAGKPDCFWVEPGNFRLENGATPQAANDGNPIPGDIVVGRSTTWFSWHVDPWKPGSDDLVTYFQVILNRLRPAR